MPSFDMHKEKLTDILTGQVGQSIKQFLGSTGLSYLAKATTGYVALVGIPALMFVDYLIEKRHERAMYRYFVNSYGAELSQLTGVDPSQLSIEKAKEAIESHQQDPGFKIFQEAKALYVRNHRNKLILSFVSAAITAAGVFVGTLLPGASALGISFFVGTGTTILATAMHAVFRLSAEEADMRSVGVQVRDLTRQASIQQVEPAKVFQVYLKAQPQLQAQVKSQFGKDYEELTLAEKNQALAAYDSVLHITEIAEKINVGVIRPTEMAWIAFGQRSGVPEKMVLQKRPSFASSDEVPSRNDFASRIQSEKLEQKAVAPILH